MRCAPIAARRGTSARAVTHPRKQLTEGRDAGVREPRDQFRVEPAAERVLRLRRLDETRLHARERGVLAITQPAIAHAPPIERGRRRWRICLHVQRDELAHAVERLRIHRGAERCERRPSPPAAARA
ncbi:hypothetical protein WK26_11620 [Burkholderia vietnamiensis]|nr:hypothetical protein WK26_11620 [Burkholderia vietnamiensis]